MPPAEIVSSGKFRISLRRIRGQSDGMTAAYRTGAFERPQLLIENGTPVLPVCRHHRGKQFLEREGSWNMAIPLGRSEECSARRKFFWDRKIYQDHITGSAEVL